MSACVECGQDVMWAEDPDGNRIPLDARADQLTGERYIVVEHNPPKAKRLSPTYVGYGNGDHRQTCPAKVRRRERV